MPLSTTTLKGTMTSPDSPSMGLPGTFTLSILTSDGTLRDPATGRIMAGTAQYTVDSDGVIDWPGIVSIPQAGVLPAAPQYRIDFLSSDKRFTWTKTIDTLPSGDVQIESLSNVLDAPVDPAVLALAGADATIAGRINTGGTASRTAVDARVTAGIAGKVSKGELFYNVRDYGATGNGATDDSAAIQATIDAAFVTGGMVYIPAGKYKVGTPLVLDLRSSIGGPTGGPASNNRRVQFVGAGNGNTALRAATDAMTILSIKGDNPLTASSYFYGAIRDIAFVGQTPTSRTATGLKLEDLAYGAVQNCSFHSLNFGLNLVGALAWHFDTVIFSDSVNGVTASAGASGPHSNKWTACEFRALEQIAYDGYTSVSGVTFDNCRFEGNGTMGATPAIIRQNTSGSAGEHGMTLINCYIENNKGAADIVFNETASTRVTLNIFGGCFNRVSSTGYTTNNIVVTGDVDLNMMGATFTSYNTYVPDVSRKYISLGATARFRDAGCRYEDTVEAPVLSQSLPFAGFVDGSVGASVATASVLPPNWSVVQNSTGLFTVTHNLGLGATDYSLVATACGTNNNVVQRVTRNANSFQVKIVGTTDAVADDDFSFSLQVLKPVR